LDATLFSNYPQGDDYTIGGTGQCSVIEPPTPYKSKKIPKKIKRMATNYNVSNLTELQKQQEQNSSTMKSKTKEYRDALQGIKNTPSMDTLEQQYTDMTIFDSQNKSNLIIWAVISASILAIIMIRK
jgi:ribosomal protein L9